jgi:transposase-like protein
MANYKEEQKERARELYFSTNYRQAILAKEVGVCERTISVWVNEGNWKMLKKMKYHAPQVEMHQLYEELRTISINISKRPPELRFPTKEELDARVKIVALMKSLEGVKDSWRNIDGDYDLYTDITPGNSKLIS